jgi:hypothetical protein
MVQFLVLGLFLLVGLILLSRWLANAEPRTVMRALKWAGVGLGLLVILFLTATGRLPAILGALGALAPMLLRWRAIANRLKSARGPSPNQRSGLDTDWLHMELDHDTGRMDGRVRRGRFAGRTLSEMNRSDVLDLLDECRAADAQSVPVLEAFLDRRFGPEWRAEAGAEAGAGAGAGDERATGRPPGGDRAMTPEEAYRMLGLEPGADKEAIKRAHRRLMMKLHPDHGGSDYIAAKLNEAKDLLLNS